MYYNVIAKAGSVEHPVCEHLNYKEALDFCIEHDWLYDWNGGLWWNLEIREVSITTVMNRHSYLLQRLKHCKYQVKAYTEQLESGMYDDDPESQEILREWIADYKAEAESIKETLFKKEG